MGADVMRADMMRADMMGVTSLSGTTLSFYNSIPAMSLPSGWWDREQPVARLRVSGFP